MDSKVIVTQEKLGNPKINFLTTDVLIISFGDEFALIKFTDAHGRPLKSMPLNKESFQKDGHLFTVTTEEEPGAINYQYKDVCYDLSGYSHIYQKRKRTKNFETIFTRIENTFELKYDSVKQKYFVSRYKINEPRSR